MDSDPLPIELVYQWMDELAANASDGVEPTISVDGG